MPRILVNPSNAQCPDYLLDIYHAVRAPFVTPESTHQQAAAILTTVWEAQNTVEKQQWQRQVDRDAEEAEERREMAEEAERIRQEASDKEKEEQQKEERKKNKSKFVPIPQRGVPTMPPIIISTIAVRRMDKGNYVPLWYFTNAGLDDASKAFNIIEEDALSLIKAGDGSTSLVPALSSKESRNVVEDSNLSWDDFCIAALRMILAMSRSEWPPDRIAMMTEFWSNLNTHPFRSSRDPLDRDALLLYQAEQRKLWHQAINSPGYRYDLSQINEELLCQTKDRLYWIEREHRERGRDHTVCADNLLTRFFFLLNNCLVTFLYFLITLTHTTNCALPPTPNACFACCLVCWSWSFWMHLIHTTMSWFMMEFPYVLPSTMGMDLIKFHESHRNSDAELSITSQWRLSS